MNKTAIKEADDATLVARFEEAARLRGRGFDEDEIGRANRFMREAINIHSELRRRGRPSREKLLTFLKHPEPWVRYTAADILYGLDPV
jgi:hypothetical protein